MTNGLPRRCAACGAPFDRSNKEIKLCRYCEIALERMKDYVTIVVRCKDCKHGEIDDSDFPNQHYCHEGCGWNDANFFCSYGERKIDD